MASQAITSETPHGLSVGNVFSRSFNIIKANPVATLGLTFALIAVPQLITDLIIGPAWRAAQANQGMYVGIGLYGIIAALLWLVAYGALIHVAIAHDQGRNAKVAEVLRLGVTRALPLLAVEILFLIGVWLGTIFLVVPGIMLAVMWSVSTIAVVAERTGIFGAFGRSRALTKGARWRVFGIGLLAIVIYFLISLALGIGSMAASGTLGAFSGHVEAAAVQSPSILLQLLQWVISAAIISWATLVFAAIFIELRHWKDGPDVDRLTEIFA